MPTTCILAALVLAAALGPAAAVLPCLPISEDHVQWTLDKIAKAQIITSPWPHVQIEEYLHPQVYACAIHYWPEDPEWRIRKTSQDGVGTRPNRTAIDLENFFHNYNYRRAVEENVQPLRNGYSALSSRNTIDFWRDYKAKIGGENALAVTNAWLNKFEKTLSVRPLLKDIWQAMGTYVENHTVAQRGSLHWDEAGYSVMPHLDTASTWIVTLLQYMPQWDELELMRDQGTLLVKRWEPDDQQRHFESGGRPLPIWDKWNNKVGLMHGPLRTTQYELKAKTAFIPNSILAFAPCDSSWHAVEEVREGYHRKVMATYIEWGPGKEHRLANETAFDRVGHSIPPGECMI